MEVAYVIQWSVIDFYDYQLPASMRQIQDTNAAKRGLR